ncbi:hypothetical protein I5Q81_12285, partial [Turicimonas muris]
YTTKVKTKYNINQI